MKQRCLMLGAGHTTPTRKLSAVTSAREEDTVWETLDFNQEARPRTVFDLEQLEKGEQLPYSNDYFDEIHAYEVLEHFGRQGDARGFFYTFKAFWRVLKYGGLLIGSSPAAHSPWLWGDPGHTRAITPESLSFLTRRHYDQLGKTTASDYRKSVDPCWWELEHSRDEGNTYVFALRKIR